MPGPYDALNEGFKYWSPKSHLEGDDFFTMARLKLPASTRAIRKGHLLVAAANGTFDRVAVVGTDEIQTVTITGAPTGGTFTLTFGGKTTTAIAYNATAGAVQAALEALTTIGAGNVIVTGGPLPATAVTVTFVGDLSSTDVAQLTSTASLTGGTTPATAHATTTAGVKGYVTTATRILGFSNEWDNGTIASWPRMFPQGVSNPDGKFWTDAKRYVFFPDYKGMVYEGAVEYNVVADETLVTNVPVSVGYNAYKDEMFVFTGDTTNAIVKVIGVPEGEIGKLGGRVYFSIVDGASEWH